MMFIRTHNRYRIVWRFVQAAIATTLCVACGRARYLQQRDAGGAPSREISTGGTSTVEGTSSGGAEGSTDEAEVGWGGTWIEEDCLNQTLSPTVELSLNATRDSAGELHPEKITELNIYVGAGLSGVECLPALEKLTVSLWSLAALSPADEKRLEKLSNLKALTLSGVSSIEFLTHLTALERLNLGAVVTSIDLAPLTALKHLKELWLNGLHDVDTLEPLRGLTELRLLNLFDVHRDDGNNSLSPSFLYELQLEELSLFAALEEIDLAQLDTSRLTKLHLEFANIRGLELLGPPATAPGQIVLEESTATQNDQLCERGWCAITVDELANYSTIVRDCSLCTGKR